MTDKMWCGDSEGVRLITGVDEGQVELEFGAKVNSVCGCGVEVE